MNNVINNRRSYNEGADSWENSLKKNVGHKYLEKPAMMNELPDSLEGKSILCIGIGSGDELKEIIKRTPNRVVGIDISTELLKLCEIKFPNIELYEMDMHDMKFYNDEFDFIYSSLTFHYSHDWDLLLKEINRVLKSGGQLLFSTHNPSYWMSKPKTGNIYTNSRNITLTEHTAILPGNIEVTYYNHLNESLIKETLVHNEFTIQSFYNPNVISKVNGDDLEAYNKLKDKNSRIPLFIIINAIKNI